MFGLLTKSLQNLHAHQPATLKSPSAAAPGGYADICSAHPITPYSHRESNKAAPCSVR